MHSYSPDSWLWRCLIKWHVFQARPTLAAGHPRFGISKAQELEQHAGGSPLLPVALGIQWLTARMSELELPNRRSSLIGENWSPRPFLWPLQCLSESQRVYLGLLRVFKSTRTWAARRFARLGRLKCLCNCFLIIYCCIGSHSHLLLYLEDSYLLLASLFLSHPVSHGFWRRLRFCDP